MSLILLRVGQPKFYFFPSLEIKSCCLYCQIKKQNFYFSPALYVKVWELKNSFLRKSLRECCGEKSDNF